MAKDDYFIIVYQLLKYLYERVKNEEYPEEEKLNSRYFNIPVNYLDYILDNLIEERYIKGIKSSPTPNIIEPKNKISSITCIIRVDIIKKVSLSRYNEALIVETVFDHSRTLWSD